MLVHGKSNAHEQPDANHHSTITIITAIRLLQKHSLVPMAPVAIQLFGTFEGYCCGSLLCHSLLFFSHYSLDLLGLLAFLCDLSAGRDLSYSMLDTEAASSKYC